MTVYDLIQHLQEYDPESEVVVWVSEQPETFLDIEDIDDAGDTVFIEVG